MNLKKILDSAPYEKYQSLVGKTFFVEDCYSATINSVYSEGPYGDIKAIVTYDDGDTIDGYTPPTYNTCEYMFDAFLEGKSYYFQDEVGDYHYAHLKGYSGTL